MMEKNQKGVKQQWFLLEYWYSLLLYIFLISLDKNFDTFSNKLSIFDNLLEKNKTQNHSH